MRTDTRKPLPGHPCATRAEQIKRTYRPTTSRRPPPTPVPNEKSQWVVHAGLCDMCTDSKSSPRNGLPKSDKQVRISQALWDATSRPLCGRPERARTTGLNSQVCCGDGVGSARRAERPCASRVRNLQLYAYRPTCNSLMTFALLVRTPTCRGGAAYLSRPR